MILEVSLLVLAYIVGSIPFSIVVGRLFTGVDVRKHGSGNPGGTNALRYLGKKYGLLVVFLDVLKGGWLILIIKLGWITVDPSIPIILYGVAAVLGHVFSVFLRFGGGKAVATSGGLVIVLNPLMALILAIVFFVVLKLTKYVSVASTATALGLVVLSAIMDLPILPYSAFLCLLVLIRHQSNYRKLLRKEESKITWL